MNLGDAGDRGNKAQRLRITYARDKPALEIGHLELTRVWEEALTAAGVELSYSRGNRRQPRLTMAAGLPMGVTSGGELLDAITSKVCPTTGLLKRLTQHLADGFRPIAVREVGMGLPALPAATRWADYDVEVRSVSEQQAHEDIERFMAATSVPWEDTRGQKVRHYDLRSLVDSLAVGDACDGCLMLRMRLRCAADGVGRAEQVTKALGLGEPVRVHRRRLVLDEESPARAAWRRKGRYL